MLKRIELASKSVARTQTAWFYHFVRGSIDFFYKDVDEELQQYMGFHTNKNKKRYIEKWGKEA